MADAVLDLISGSAVSKALSAGGFTKDGKIGHQTRPFEPLPRTGGFRVKQEQGWSVEIWQRQSGDEDRAATYGRMTEALTGRGYQAEPSTQLGKAGSLIVTRRRPPTAAEWAALDLLASTPLVLEAVQLRAAFESGTKDLSADVLAALHRSGLIETSRAFPLLRQPESDTYPDHGRVLSLSSEALSLLIRRNQARQARGLWALIAPEHRDPEPPPLLAGDPGRKRPEPVEV